MPHPPPRRGGKKDPEVLVLTPGRGCLPRVLSALLVCGAAGAADPRNIASGWKIPDENYADQPYVVVTNDGNWLCVLTTGKGVEGKPGQHIVATISSDKGRTWSPLVDIEPAGGPEASWAMPLKTPWGRVYVFYTYNRDNVRAIPLPDGGSAARVDTLGAYAFKYSDDHGRTWSRERYYIPMRPMAIDRDNNFQGRVLFFWGVGKPVIHGRDAYFGWAKVGNWWTTSEGMLMRSGNVLVERDPAKVRWEMFPEGDHGLRAPKGPISEETSVAPLSAELLYAVYRSEDGYLCHAYSRDRGRTWTPPAHATYSPGGRRIKHPRAAGFVWKCSNGKYLLWYHNNGGEAVHAVEKFPFFENRNPAFLAGGVVKNGMMYWSEPELLLYDDDPKTRISYPDLIEDGGRFFVTETQKSVARVHEIDRTLLEGLWGQAENARVAREGLALEWNAAQCRTGAEFRMPRLAPLEPGSGFSIDFWIRLRDLRPGQVILDTRDGAGRGLLLATSARGALRLTLSDGAAAASWDSDPGTHPGTIRVKQWQHVAFIADGGPRIISVVVDGVFNDGGAVRQFGFGRFPKELRDVNGLSRVRLAAPASAELRSLRIYNRCLRTSEAVGNWRAEAPRFRTAPGTS